ncbi:hypothetical protein AJ78_08438, partial [Emergomyces pasteurianus Ep9510]
MNLRSGGTPDLTKEYMPTRTRSIQTPEAQQGLETSLSTPDINQKIAASGVFKLEDNKQNDSNSKLNNNFQDPADNRMSDASDQSDHDNASEKTCMRLEIVRLQHEVELMKASRETAFISKRNVNLNLTEYLQQCRRMSALVKILDKFKDQIRLIK